MHRQLAILLLAVSVVLGSVTACPRGVLACSMVGQVNHQCCGNHLSLRSRNCCGGSTQLPAPALSTTARQDNAAPIHAAWAVTHQTCSTGSAQPTASGRYRLEGNPPPPDTPLAQHTALLL